MSTSHSDISAAPAPTAPAGKDQYSADASTLAGDVLNFEKSGSNDTFNGLMAEWQTINDKDKTSPGYVQGVGQEAASLINHSKDPIMPTSAFNDDGSISFYPSVLDSVDSHLPGSLAQDMGGNGNLMDLWPGGEGYGQDLANSIYYGPQIGASGADSSGPAIDNPDSNSQDS